MAVLKEEATREPVLPKTGVFFVRLLRYLQTKARPPRIHDLRHSFAVNALRHCYVSGEDVQARLPLLSTYMGHVSVASTHYYLSFIEEIRSEASERFYQRFGQLLFTSFADVEKSQGYLNGGGK